ncbi:integrase [Burkholderia vietnamiensis]|uniref:integrase n=1 Tax=Burkholderia vietnamiensis TaxID=60552 RepID=UPI001FC82C64|nr:integrase [Burkholderia vietnamiensis]
MVDITTFMPQAHLDAQVNMAGFIELCRTQLTAFGSSLDFDSDRWDVSEYIERKGMPRAVTSLVFSNLATCGKRKGQVMMSEPFRSFAKAYMRYQHGLKPTTDVGKRMIALRAVEVALLETGTSDSVQTNAHVLNRAAQLIAARCAPLTAYGTATQLQQMADFLCDNHLIAVSTRWRHSVKRPENHRDRVGKAADERRAAKLPSEAALNALPGVFRVATQPSDVLVSSVTAMLCSAPDRIGEVLSLPANCEVRQSDDGKAAYGLRWWPAKGAEPMVKWVLPSMVGVVEEALKKIRRLTDEAREVARWYEKNPAQIYLTEDMEHFRTKEWLDMVDLAKIIYAEPVSRPTPGLWCNSNGVPKERRGKGHYVRFVDVEAAVLRQLPRGFPIADKKTGLKYGDSLTVIQRNALDSYRPRFRCVVDRVSYNQIRERLGAMSAHGKQSIFDRCGFYEPDWGPIRVRTHQLRHYLNTLAQAGGLSQLDIAKWSGRKDVWQNRYYDHEASDAIVARIRAAVGNDTRMFGPLATGPRAALITRDEFARLKVPTAHTTDFGYCVHDYVMAPCEMHRDCLNCGEQVCVKGEVDKGKRIRQAHAEATRLLALAEQAESKGEFGASEWAERHRAYLDRITALLDVLDNPTVPSGAVIQLLPADMPSRLEHAAQARALLPLSVDADVRAMPEEEA